MAHDRPKLGSLFAGIGGIDKGFEDAGWETAYQVESDGFCNRVLQEHWPAVLRWGDIRGVKGSELPEVDCVVAGVPCQDVSTAGKGAGLNGERTGLFYEFVRILGETRPRWFLFENVPGLLSSNERRDFWLVILALCEVGYGLAWRCLDSRYFGVPQRRRRIYIVGHLGGPCPPTVLFESKGGKGNPAKSEGTRQGVAYSVSPRAGGGRLEREATYVLETAHRGGNQTGFGRRASYSVSGTQAVAIAENQRNELRLMPATSALSAGGGKPGRGYQAIIVPTIRAPDSRAPRGADGKRRDGGPAEKIPIVPCAPPDADGVRKVTGIPRWLDACAFDWPPDAPRYRALGNAVTVNVARWIGARMLNAWAKEEAGG